MKTALPLDRYRLIVCLGPGGVGKTTLSAALGLRAALDGQSVGLMTVDPAPRLLDALGLDSTAATAQPVDLRGLGARRGARLSAMRLDPRLVFDGLVERYAPSPAARHAILSDRIYRSLSGALAGVADYMAMEQLLELARGGAGGSKPSDRIVIDTPPAHQALDFLDAPRRMLELLGSRAVTLLAPRGAASGKLRAPFSMIDLAARMVLSTFDRVTGLHLLADVQSFVRNFSGMYAGFAERAAAVQALIREDNSAIVLVTVAERERVSQTREFIDALISLDLKPAAVVVNRVMAALPDNAVIEKADLPPALMRKLKRNLADFAALKGRETAALEALHTGLPNDMPLLFAADLGYEPRSLADLAAIARNLHTRPLDGIR